VPGRYDFPGMFSMLEHL